MFFSILLESSTTHITVDHTNEWEQITSYTWTFKWMWCGWYSFRWIYFHCMWISLAPLYHRNAHPLISVLWFKSKKEKLPNTHMGVMMSHDSLFLKKKPRKHSDLSEIAPEDQPLALPLQCIHFISQEQCYPIHNVTQRLKARWAKRLVWGADRRWMKLSEPAAVALIQGGWGWGGGKPH